MRWEHFWFKNVNPAQHPIPKLFIPECLQWRENGAWRIIHLHSSQTVFSGLTTKVGICRGYDPKNVPAPIPPFKTFNAIWDTGATGSVISQKIVDDCGLKPIGMTQVHTAGGECTCEVYLVNVELPNQIRIANVLVTKANMGTTEILIGMDIISLGDFALTHKNGKTCFSFRIPSLIHIDFVETANRISASKIDAYEPGLCGSGKKFKFCCKTILQP